jgi:hypothetical protein
VIKRMLLVLLGVTVVVGCRGVAQPPPDQKVHPLLAKLKPPPLNHPLQSVSLEPESPSLPQGNRPALVLVSNGRPFSGTITVSGRLTVGTARIELVSDGQPPIQILYRLPPGLSVSPGSDAPGSVTLSELSNPGGPNRKVIVQRQGSLLLAHIWLKASEPLIADLGAAQTLRQVPAPASGSERQLLTGIPVEAFDDQQRVGTIPMAKPTKIQTRSGDFQVFVATSQHVYSSGRAEEQGTGYILEAWVVRSE